MKGRARDRAFGRGWWVRLVVVVVASLVGGRAGASSASPFGRALGAPAGVVLAQPSPVILEREELEIDCTEGDSPLHPVCSFKVTYHLANPTPGDEELVGSFYRLYRPRLLHARSTEPVAIHMDGLDVRATPSTEQRERMDAIASAEPMLRGYLSDPDKQLALYDEGFRIVVPAGARKDVVFEGDLPPVRSSHVGHSGLVSPALAVRHMLLGPDEHAWDETEDEFFYLTSPLGTWAGDPDVVVHVRHRDGARFFSRMNRFERERSGGVVTERAVIRARSGQNLSFHFSFGHAPIFHGGPLVGIGPRIGRAELHTRLGYELGLHRNFVLGAVADTNFDDYVTPALTLDATTPSFLYVVPSLAIGLGGVAQFRKNVDPRAGIRTQLGISWPVVSLTFPIDIYPAENSSGSHVEAAFLTQLSF